MNVRTGETECFHRATITDRCTTNALQKLGPAPSAGGAWAIRAVMQGRSVPRRRP